MAAPESPASTTTRDPESPRPTASPLDEHAPPTTSTARTSGRATTSMILGIISIPASIIPIAAWILGVTAIVLGATARGEIRRTGIGGSGRAMAGLICGAIGVVIGLGIFIANISAAS
jgi:hypothetical protein